MVIYVPANGPEDWQALLADPRKHWRTGYSAKCFAHCWEAAGGFPPEVSKALADSGQAELLALEPLVILPEHKVPLPGGKTESQNDAWVLARNESGLVSIAVEGKVEEPFGEPLSDWFAIPTPGKRERLQYLANLLGIEDEFPPEIRYQLIHRTASAIIEARRFHAGAAVMVVHSFSPEMTWFNDFAAFCALFSDQEVEPGVIVPIGRPASVPSFLVWVVGDKNFLES